MARPSLPFSRMATRRCCWLVDAIEGAGSRGDEREAVVEELRNTKDRRSVLGRYGFDANCDTTLKDYGDYRIDDGEIAFDRLIKAG